MYIDSHCHLTHEKFANDVESVIQQAVENGVKKIYCTSGMLGHDKKVLELCKEHSEVLKPVIGISPHDADKVQNEQKLEVFELIEKNKISAIGEIGLDFHYFHKEEEHNKQTELFKEQIELAKSLDLPVVIHSRKAEEKTLDILKELNCKNFAMHCFTFKKLAEKVIEQGGLISLPTIKSKDRKYIMKNVELKHLLCETDSPYLWPSDRNEPKNVITVYQDIAKEKAMKIEKVSDIITENVTNFYR